MKYSSAHRVGPGGTTGQRGGRSLVAAHATGETMSSSFLRKLTLACVAVGATVSASLGAAGITAVPPAVYQPPSTKSLEAPTLLTSDGAPQYSLVLPAPSADEKSVLKSA